MKKTLFCAATIFLVIFVGLWIFSSEFRAKSKALGDVGGTLVRADCNYVPVVRCGGDVLKAQNNIEVVTRAAEYLVAVGGNTKVFLAIARIAAESDEECPRLNRVLDLAVMKQSESLRVLALAESACLIQTEEQAAIWQSVYDQLAANAEYASVEEGLSSRKRN